MHPIKRSNNNILNNLKDHVDTGDVLFVLSGDVSNNKQAIEALNKKCKSKCVGRRKLDQNLHSKVVDASQFVAVCEDQCADASKYGGSDGTSMKKNVSKKFSENSSRKGRANFVDTKPKRFDEPNRIKVKARGPPPVDGNWKRRIILSQMKNHRVSSTSMDDGSRPKLMLMKHSFSLV